MKHAPNPIDQFICINCAKLETVLQGRVPKHHMCERCSTSLDNELTSHDLYDKHGAYKPLNFEE